MCEWHPSPYPMLRGVWNWATPTVVKYLVCFGVGLVVGTNSSVVTHWTCLSQVKQHWAQLVLGWVAALATCKGTICFIYFLVLLLFLFFVFCFFLFSFSVFFLSFFFLFLSFFLFNIFFYVFFPFLFVFNLGLDIWFSLFF